jgi:hypothetical protein
MNQTERVLFNTIRHGLIDCFHQDQGYGMAYGNAIKALDELESTLTIPQPEASETGYWWCPECRREVDARNVTFEEAHDTCGRYVVWKEPLHPEASDREIAEKIVAIVQSKEGYESQAEDELTNLAATIRADERRKVEDECLSKLKNPDGVHVMILRGTINASSYEQRIRDEEQRKADDLRSIIFELIASEPSSDDPRLDYVEIQVDRNTYQDARKSIGRVPAE